ncbi:unnamed protein product [Durusdinium trenchii]|uniref:Uncharacterized protein n=1 Tax=Durusdinium trenchii TaxID=1381693 RepID=A0ABP0SUX4_9DINO
MAASEERILLTATILDEESLTEENQQGKSNKWLVRGVSAVLVFAAVAALVLLKFTPPAASHVLHPQALYSAGIQSCAAGTMHQCPEDWKNPSQIMGYHCLHKLTRQTSEAAYQSSGGACRPASDGPFPEDDCQLHIGFRIPVLALEDLAAPAPAAGDRDLARMVPGPLCWEDEDPDRFCAETGKR